MTIKKLTITLILMLALGLLLACQPQQTVQNGGEEDSQAVQTAPADAETETEAEALTEVTLMLDWVPNTNHTGLYVAQQQGFYNDAGLQVNIIQPGENSVEQAVGSGSADFGVSYQEGVTLARTETVPIVSVAAIIQHNTSGFASRAEADIETPADFEGKTYGGWGSPVEQAMLTLLMNCAGGDASEVEILDTGYADFLAITERGDIDFAWIFYGWDGINAGLQGIDLNMIMLHDWPDCVPDYYTPVLITNETLIAEQPELVAAFMEATAKGYEFAIENPGGAADILLEAAPENDPELIRASQQWLSEQYQADASQWGLQEEAVWARYADWMYEQGLLSEQLDAVAAFSNDFLPPRQN